MIDYLNGIIRATWQQWPAGLIEEPSSIQWVLVSHGQNGWHDNVLLFGLPAGRSRPALVAKVCRSPAYNWTLRAEHAHLVDLWEILGPEAEGRLPRPLALAERGADLALLMDFCPGRKLLGAARGLWAEQPAVYALFVEAAGWLRHLHSRTASPDRAAEPASDFGPKAAAFESLFDLTPDEARELERLRGLVSATGQAAGACICLQGDFWPGNVIQRTAAPGLTLVDWQFSRWSGDASQDVYLFPLAGAVEAAAVAPPEGRARAAAGVLWGWQSSLLPAYLEAYGPPGRYSLLPAREGMLACCVEMATRPYLAFGVRQADGLLWRTLFAELRDWPASPAAFAPGAGPASIQAGAAG